VINEQDISFLNEKALWLLLFGGKGGVGKTTLAAATALHWAYQSVDRKVLVISIDPAHSLSDSFDQPIGDEITPIADVPNLFAWEMDAARRLEDFKRCNEKVLKTIADRGTYFDLQDISEFFDLSLPGLDELMAVIEIARLVKEKSYGMIILDTAPTGHTLRLLALPQLMKHWLHLQDLMLAKYRYMANTFGRYRPDETDAFLKTMSVDLNRLLDLLGDANRTEFVPVTIPEAMSIAETGRLVDALKNLNIRVRTLVVNRIVTHIECPFCGARHAGQVRPLEEIQNRFSAWRLLKVPLMPNQVRGQVALQGVIQVMSGSYSLPDLPSSLPFSSKSPGDGELAVLGDKLDTLTQTQLLLFGGKGGVGKTSIAAATALHLACNPKGQMLEKTLLFSTDPAHSLSDSLNQVIGDRITAVTGAPQLFALEMNADNLLEELKRDYITEINDVFETFMGGSFNLEFDRQVMEELISQTPPGVDELMALIKIMEFIEVRQYTHYVLDLAPTGHALRFLETPALMRKWFITFFRLLLKYQGVIQLRQVSELLLKLSKQLRQVQQLLTDPERCQFVAVTIPEAMAVSETSLLLQHLKELSVAYRWVVVNMVVPDSSCTFCATARRAQQPYLEEISTLAPELIHVPLFSQPVVGIADLLKVANIIFKEPSPGARNG
jgi:arsenite-transporting ATPase